MKKTILLVIIIFWLRGVLLLDPDFGWHIRMGEIIEKSGIPKTDPFSYSMPSYPFVDHEWLTNIVLAKLYPMLGANGLGIVFAFLVALALFIQSSYLFKKWAFVPFVLVAGSLFPFFGIRPQIITWVFFSALLFLLFNSKGWKWRFVLSLLFLAWSNLHGGFGLGIVALLVVIMVRMWVQKKLVFGDIILVVSSITATLINPYGIYLWKELWMSISDQSLRFSISEWKIALFIPSFTLWVFVTFSVVLVLRYRARFLLSQLVLYIVLLIVGVSSIRHMPIWLLIAFPMTIKTFGLFAEEAKDYKGGIERLSKLYKIFAIPVVFVVGLEIAISLNAANSLREEIFYPKQAVRILKDQKSCGQVFSTYGWGGYLIWKLPEKKVFIDGRMPSWRRDSAPVFESNYAFKEYNEILRGESSVNLVIEKYNIDTFLLPVEKLEESLTGLFKKQDKGYEKFIKQLKQNGMVEIYKDNVSVMYRSRNPKQCSNPRLL